MVSTRKEAEVVVVDKLDEPCMKLMEQEIHQEEADSVQAGAERAGRSEETPATSSLVAPLNVLCFSLPGGFRRGDVNTCCFSLSPAVAQVETCRYGSGGHLLATGGPTVVSCCCGARCYLNMAFPGGCLAKMSCCIVGTGPWMS